MSENIAEVAQRQLDAYNHRDLTGLLAVYAEDAEMYEHPGTLVAKGRPALAARFQTRFLEKNLRAELIQRICIGNRVIDYEKVKRTFPEGAGMIELVMIYEIQGQFIHKAWIIAGPPTLS